MVIGGFYPPKCTFLILEEQNPGDGKVKGKICEYTLSCIIIIYKMNNSESLLFFQV